LNFTKNIKQQFYYYEGSQTTKDCEEIVNWVVAKEIQDCSITQITTIASKITSNSQRPINSLNSRKIYLTQEPLPPVRVGSIQLVAEITAAGLLFLIVINFIQLYCKNSGLQLKMPDQKLLNP